MADNRGVTPRTDGPGRFDTAEIDPATLIPPRSGRKQILVGAFVLIGIVATLGALFSLTDPALFRGRYIVTTNVENAGGLRKGDPVQLRGVNIGRVHDFEIQPNGVAIHLELEGEYKVPKDSRVELASSGLLGGMTATILPGESSEPLEGGDVIPGATEPGAFSNVGELSERADTVLGRADTLLGRAASVLDPRTVQALHASTQELQGLLASSSTLVDENRREIRAILGSMRTTTAEIQAAQPGASLQRLTTRMDSLTLALGATATRLDQATTSLQVILGRIEHGQGTLGRLSTDDALYDNLNAAAANMRLLAEDIRKNPKRYINVSVF